jgi:hypothetical protein
MPKYLLLLHEEPNSNEGLSADEIQGVIAEYVAWRRGIAHQVVGGEKLTDEGGRILSGQGAALRVVDGPYSEAKEVLGGFFLITARDYDQAVQIASSCPHLKYGRRIEVRQVEEVGG